MPTRGDLWPPKLPRPAGALNGELGSFGGVGQQVDGHIDPQALGLYILDAQMEAAVLFPDVSLHTGNLDAELNAFRRGGVDQEIRVFRFVTPQQREVEPIGYDGDLAVGHVGIERAVKL